ncbi:hypothetical protein PanWU01x14_231310 [Parasponia andersonii]|uniref:Uncharacterized protein n=1 Tax=Parasponia andersonii TaxID=3476 RepID=A0A2P5BKG2_PARAD|nr:hypothetical protein PanWU01x14_231310 [Parasponia andersonii]
MNVLALQIRDHRWEPIWLKLRSHGDLSGKLLRISAMFLPIVVTMASLSIQNQDPELPPSQMMELLDSLRKKTPYVSGYADPSLSSVSLVKMCSYPVNPYLVISSSQVTPRKGVRRNTKC